MAKAQWISGRTISLPASALVDPKLKIRTKLILAAIAAVAGRNGHTKPISKGEIAAACGLPATNMARELRELVAAGWLEVSHQPGSSSIYRLKEPMPQAEDTKSVYKSEAPTTQSNMKMLGAQMTTCAGTVAKMEKHNNSWLVSFSLPDASSVSTIFLVATRPCEIGDTAKVDVREWNGRKNIAGGAACGVHWISHHPSSPIELKVVEIVVSEFDRYATPAGHVLVSLLGKSDQLQAKASLPDAIVPKDIEVGSLIRISRRDGGLIVLDTGQNILDEIDRPSRLEIAGDAYIIERLSLEEHSGEMAKAA